MSVETQTTEIQEVKEVQVVDNIELIDSDQKIFDSVNKNNKEELQAYMDSVTDSIIKNQTVDASNTITDSVIDYMNTLKNGAEEVIKKYSQENAEDVNNNPEKVNAVRSAMIMLQNISEVHSQQEMIAFINIFNNKPIYDYSSSAAGLRSAYKRFSHAIRAKHLDGMKMDSLINIIEKHENNEFVKKICNFMFYFLTFGSHLNTQKRVSVYITYLRFTSLLVRNSLMTGKMLTFVHEVDMLIKNETKK